MDDQITAVVRETHAELDAIMRIADEMRKLLTDDDGGSNHDLAS